MQEVLSEGIWLQGRELVGEHVTLVPLERAHRDAMVTAASDGQLWRLWFTSVPSEQTIDAYLDKALQDKQSGVSFPFVVVHNASAKVIGSTRYCNADNKNQRLEIGYTWYAKRFQRSAVNTECKLMLLKHAFEALGAAAVEFRTNWHNLASRNAIARLGARQDGVLRNHTRMADGNYRDTVVFSIVDREWPMVEKHLAFKLEAY